MKKSKCLFIFVLLILASSIDFFMPSNYFATGFVSLVVSFIVFSLGVWKIRLGRKTSIILFVVNFIFLMMTFKTRFYLFNIFILSFLIWSLITPRIIKYKNNFKLTIITILTVVHLLYFTGFRIPVFTLALYPIYLFGYNINKIKLEKSKFELIVILSSIIFTMLSLFVLLFKIRELVLFSNIGFLNVYSKASMVAVFMPFILIFYLLFFLSINLFLFNFTPIFKHSDSYVEGMYIDIKNILKFLYCFISFFLFIGVLLFISNLVTYSNIRTALRGLFLPQSMFNLIFLCSIYLVLISMIGRGLSTVILSCTYLLLVVANYIKLKFFNEPFYPWDIFLFKNALMISKQYIDLKIISLVIIVIVTLLALIIRFRKFVKLMLRPKLKLILLPFALLLIAINISALNNPKYLNDLNMGKSWYIGSEVIKKNGVFTQTIFYLSDLDRYIFKKPQDYSSKEMMSINGYLTDETVVPVNSELVNQKSKEKPNIIVIMSESFWDPTQFKEVSYNKDITKNLKNYEKGKIISPVFGGETANTEFEALTGMSNYFFTPGVVPYNAYVKRNIPSIASVFRDNGYSTVAIHPNNASFYNRNMVYKNFGFDKFIDISDFDKNTDFNGTFVTDDKLTDKILNNLDKGNKPKFIFAVTIQNHDPYYNIYKNTEIRATSKKLDAVGTSILSNYGQNIYDADKALGKLINELKKSKTPTLVYFFGDHLPRLGEPKGIYDIYNDLDYFKGVNNIYKDIRLYETPFVKWSNYKDMSMSDKNISPAQISYEVLKDSKVNYPAYFNILGKLREVYPVISNRIGENIDVNNQLIKDYKLIEYDLLFGKQYLINSNAENLLKP